MTPCEGLLHQDYMYQSYASNIPCVKYKSCRDGLEDMQTCRHAGRGSADLTVYLIKVQRLGGDLHFELGSRLIYQVNGLVWQKPVCNISV